MSEFLDLQGAKDLNTDAIHLSAVSNSKDPVTGAAIDTHTNRVGGTDYTLRGFWNALGPVVMPWTSVVGGTLTQPNQAFLHPANGNYYSWTGGFPKVVSPSTEPTASGSGYVPRTDVVLHPQVRESLRRSYADAGYNLVVGSFETGGILASSTDVLLQESTGKAYSWTGAYPSGGYVVGAGTDPLAIGSGYAQLVGGKDCVYLSDFNPPLATIVNGVASGDDASSHLTAAIMRASELDLPLNLGSLKIRLSGPTITILSGDVLIIGNPGEAQIWIDGWGSKISTSDQGVSASTAFSFGLDGSNYSEKKSTLLISGVEFHNNDSTVATRVIHARNSMKRCEFSYGGFYGFSCGAVVGNYYFIDSPHVGAKAQSGIDYATIFQWEVVSDSISTGQSPKSFHLYCPADSHTSICNFVGNGVGYVFRQNGGIADTIPDIGHGSVNFHFTNNNVVTQTTGQEYCQVTKTQNVVIANNTADASYGVAPHNFMDLFNCLNVTFTGNAVTGGGLLFHGHGDLNNGNFPGALIGSRGLSAVGNTITNPTHYSVFNLGGDGVVNGNRGYENASIVGNQVYVKSGHTFPQDCAFVYAFLARKINLSGNTVQKLAIYFKTYYCKDVLIDNEILDDVPSEIFNTGNDINTFRVGTLLKLGSTGSTSTFTGNNICQFKTHVGKQNFKDIIICDSDVVAARMYTATGSSGYVSNGSVTLSAAKANDIGVYRVTTALVQYAGSATVGEYLVKATGTSTAVIALSSDASITITATATASAVSVVVSHATGTRTIYATIQRII